MYSLLGHNIMLIMILNNIYGYLNLLKKYLNTDMEVNIRI